MKIMIVEDDEGIACFLREVLTEASYAVEVIGNGKEALQTAMTLPFDVILLDVMLPGMDGFEVCRRLRAAHVATPILIITARDTLEDKLTGLDGGADDYIVKPFEMAELLARVRALLRRNTSNITLLQVGDLILNPITYQATRDGTVIDLSRTEYALLEYLMRNAGRVLTRCMIFDHVWQYDFEGNDNVLDVYMSYLRRKIDKGNSRPLIHTLRGIGYRMEAT